MRLTRHTHVFAFLGLATVLCLLELTIVRSAWFSLNADLLSLVVTLDLTLGIPFLYYLLLVRARRSPAIALAPVFLIGVVLAHLILPTAWQMHLSRIENLLIVVEGCALVFGILKARAVILEYRKARPSAVYASDALKASLQQVFGSSRAVDLFVTELSLMYYVAFGWFQSFNNTNPAHIPVSIHRKSGYAAVIALFSSLIVLETAGLHLVIQHWSPAVAWVLSGTSIYTILWVIGHYHSVRLHPIVIGTQALHIRNGFRWQVDVDWTNIAAVRRGTPVKRATSGYLNMAVYGEPRFVLQLREPVMARGLFGSRKQANLIGLSVDDETLFQEELSRRIPG